MYDIGCQICMYIYNRAMSNYTNYKNNKITTNDNNSKHNTNYDYRVASEQPWCALASMITGR